MGVHGAGGSHGSEGSQGSHFSSHSEHDFGAVGDNPNKPMQFGGIEKAGDRADQLANLVGPAQGGSESHIDRAATDAAHAGSGDRADSSGDKIQNLIRALLSELDGGSDSQQKPALQSGPPDQGMSREQKVGMLQSMMGSHISS